MSYAEDLARWRVQRQQQQIINRCEQIRAEHAEVARERDLAISQNDLDLAELRDDEAMQLEAEWRHYNPPRPQYHQKDLRLLRKNANYFNRYGTGAAQAAQAVHQHVTQRMGVTQNHPRYEEMMKSGMELYAKDFGCPYDRNEEMLTADEACKISGVSPKLYNHYAQRLYGNRKR
jgi:hypothetical protein